MLFSEPEIIDDVLGHLGPLGVAPTYLDQVEEHPADLLGTTV